MKKPIIWVLVAIFVVGVFAITSDGAIYTQTQRNKDTAHRIAEIMRAEGHAENHPVIIACQTWWQEEDAKERTATAYTDMEQRAKYPVACAVWQQLRDAGISAPVAAGIIGNMMAECGGQTLDLDPYIYSSGYYGLCMWSLYYFPTVDGLGVTGQVEFLLSTLDNITAGGGSVEYFLSLTDVRQAARYFSDYYERPASWSEQRANNAEVAYRFFGG